MGDEDDTHTLALELEHHFEELFHLAVVQGGGRFVQNQDLAVGVHGPGDGDHLLNGQGVVLKVLGHVHLDVQPPGQLRRLCEHGLAVDGMKWSHGLPPDVQIFRDTEVGAEVDLLVDGGDAHILGVQGGVVLHGPLHAVHPDFPGLEIVDSGEAFD